MLQYGLVRGAGRAHGQNQNQGNTQNHSLHLQSDTKPRSSAPAAPVAPVTLAAPTAPAAAPPASLRLWTEPDILMGAGLGEGRGGDKQKSINLRNGGGLSEENLGSCLSTLPQTTVRSFNYLYVCKCINHQVPQRPQRPHLHLQKNTVAHWRHPQEPSGPCTLPSTFP